MPGPARKHNIAEAICLASAAMLVSVSPAVAVAADPSAVGPLLAGAAVMLSLVVDHEQPPGGPRKGTGCPLS